MMPKYPNPNFKKSEAETLTSAPPALSQPPVEAPKASVQEEVKPTIILSDIDGYIYDRLKEQPKTRDDVKISAPEYDSSNSVLKLPKELEKYKSEYGFKWIYKVKRAIDRNLDVLGFVLLTKQHFPELPKRMFSSQGCIERGDAILGFIPIKRAEFLRSEPGRLSMERIKNIPMEKWKEGGEKYYKPSLTEEKDGQEIVAGIQPDSKDFQES